MSQTTATLLRSRELILGGELAAGTRVSELSMVERLGVSRTPVRAALARLEEEGLLKAIPFSGYAIRAFTEREIDDAIMREHARLARRNLQLALEDKSMHHLIPAGALIESRRRA